MATEFQRPFTKLKQTIFSLLLLQKTTLSMDYKSEDQKENEIVNLETVMKKSVALTSWNFSQKEM